MNEPRCATPVRLEELLAYLVGEMDEAAQSRLEEHLFGCAQCSGRIGRLVKLTQAIRQELQDGRVDSVIPASFVQRLKDAGMRVREYRMQPGGSINCTIAPEDDLVVAHLHAPLREVRRLDLVFEGEGAFERLEDIAFDPAADEVVFAPSAAELRTLGVVRKHAQLIAVGPDAERVIGSYTFNHSPYR